MSIDSLPYAWGLKAAVAFDEVHMSLLFELQVIARVVDD
jgi:hypothetical protein